ncbi:MAG: tetratricopeptide repeat protein [Candidatus Sumerlaeia bacterium]|nr:tetratricopeptide repeat protein [Candidatus Sumerlaeia bacterium]
MSARTRNFAVAAAMLVAWVCSAGRAQGDALRSLTAEGNRLLAEKKYDEALQKYRAAQVESPESPHLYFNIARALQAQEKYDEAIAEYRKVYSREQPRLGAWALYNIGVCQYRQAEQALAAQDYQKAMQLLEQCMDSNREAMKIAPDDEDPKYNFEQARRKWKEALDALKKQQEEQQKQQENPQQQQRQNQTKQNDGATSPTPQPEQPKPDEQKKDEPQKGDQGTSQPKEQEQPTSGTGEGQAAPQPPKIGEMSPEDVERILNSLPEQNADDMRRFLMPRGRPDYRIEKDW